MVGVKNSLSCIICGSIDHEFLYQALPDYLLSNYSIKISYVQCKNCGLIFQYPPLPFSKVQEYYPENYESFITKIDIDKMSTIQKASIYYGLYKRIRIIRKFKKSGSILDVGCSTGLFLKTLQDTGKWNCTGIEPNEYAAAIALSYDLNVLQGTLENLDMSKNQFDVITLWDVLEHIPNPNQDLERIYRIIKDDGILVVRVPNIDSIDARLFGAYWAGFDPPRHYFAFSEQTLRRLLHKNNFEVIYRTTNIGSYPTFLLSLRFFLDYCTKRRHIKLQGLYSILSTPFARIVLSPLFYLTGVLRRGPSQIVVARKIQ